MYSSRVALIHSYRHELEDFPDEFHPEDDFHQKILLPSRTRPYHVRYLFCLIVRDVPYVRFACLYISAFRHDSMYGSIGCWTCDLNWNKFHILDSYGSFLDCESDEVDDHVRLSDYSSATLGFGFDFDFYDRFFHRNFKKTFVTTKNTQNPLTNISFRSCCVLDLNLHRNPYHGHFETFRYDLYGSILNGDSMVLVNNLNLFLNPSIF